MKTRAKKILWLLLPMAVFLAASHAPAHEESHGNQETPVVKEKSSTPVPDLADIIPLAVKLSSRLAALENKVTDLLDVSSLEAQYAGIEANLTGPADQLQQFKDSKDLRFNKQIKVREAIEREDKVFQETGKPIGKAIGQLGAWRMEWLEEKKRWHEWQSSLAEGGALDQLEATFEKAYNTIDKALDLILPHLEAMLALQEKAGHIQAQIYTLTAQLDDQISGSRFGVLMDKSPPMFSSRYFSQFSGEMWYAVQQGIEEISWPGSRFFDRQGWIVLLHGLLTLALIIAVFRNRQVLEGLEQWRFLALRPFAAGVFFANMMAFLLFEYGGAPATWDLFITILGGISFARLIGGLVETSWKRQFVYGLMFIFIITRVMEVVNLPLPLFRLYTVLAALVGLFYCLRWAGESVRLKDNKLFAWSLRLLSFLFFIIIVVEIWGEKEGLPNHLFIASIDSIAITLILILFMHMIRGGLEWLFLSSPLRRTAALFGDTKVIVNRMALLIDVAIWGLVLLPAILLTWEVFNSLKDATIGILSLGFNLGSQRISVGLVIAAAAVVYVSFLISRILQKLLINELLIRRGVDLGVRLSIARLLHYVIIFAGFLTAISTLGFDVTKLTIMLSALGIGIGFGLQGIVNNFVSGLILLFERPVRVGDTVEVEGKWGTIKRIGLRSTTFQSFDNADVIIPNADLVSNQVTNWTLNNRRVRLIIPVGVAYGSDIPLVVETLMACAKANSLVAKTPEHQVLFLGFGESSLDFELRVWVMDVDVRLIVKSALHQDIDKRFREAKIEIAFPQRDLHLRSVDESIILRPPESTG